MMRFKASTETKASIDLAFLHMADPELLATWVPGMQDFEFTGVRDDGDLTGARFQYVAVNKQAAATVRGEVLEYDPPRLYAALFENGPLRYEDRFEFEVWPRGTRITGSMRHRPNGVIGFLAMLILLPLTPLLQRQVLGKLRRACDRAAAAGQ